MDDTKRRAKSVAIVLPWSLPQVRRPMAHRGAAAGARPGMADGDSGRGGLFGGSRGGAVRPCPGWDSGVLVTYNLADRGDVDPLDGLAVEVDFRFDGIPVSIVGHVSRTEPSSYTGAGLRITHDIGPFELFGHYLFGQARTGTDARDGVSMKRGGGVNVPLSGRLFLRMGADHDGQAVFTVVGLGARW